MTKFFWVAAILSVLVVAEQVVLYRRYERKRVLGILRKMNRERGVLYKECSCMAIIATKGTPKQIAERIIKKLSVMERQGKLPSQRAVRKPREK